MLGFVRCFECYSLDSAVGDPTDLVASRAMIEEILTDDERQRLVQYATMALVDTRGDPALAEEHGHILHLLSKMEGTDTVLVARRAYASRAMRFDRPPTLALYHNPDYPPRPCYRCQRSYTGPTIFCSWECANNVR